jgi:hypothetical protein
VSADPTIDQTPDVEVLGAPPKPPGDMLHQLDEKKWKPLLKPWPIKPVVEGGFTIDNYTYDPDTNTLTCPLRERCTTSATGRRTVTGRRRR